MYPSIANELNGLFIHHQVSELVKQGCNIRVISAIPWVPFPLIFLSKKWLKYSKVPKRSFLEGVEVYYPRYLAFPRSLFFKSSGFRMFLGIKNLIEKIYESFKFDLIHVHVSLPDGYAGMRIAAKYKKPLILNIHGQDFQRIIFKNRRCREKVRQVTHFSRKTICVSSKLKNIGEQLLKIDKNKLIVINNGIDLNIITRCYDRKIYDEYKDKRLLLSISNLINIKGIDYNIRAMARLLKKHHNLIYFIIGDGKERYSLEKLAKDLNINSNVKFLGYLGYRKTMEYISICDVFSLPSWEEGFGVVYLEAMAHGKPVIACKDQGISDIIKDGENGLLIKPKNVEMLVEAIDFLISNPKKAQKIGDRGRKMVLNNYTWEKNVQKTIKIYNEVLGSN